MHTTRTRAAQQQQQQQQQTGARWMQRSVSERCFLWSRWSSSDYLHKRTLLKWCVRALRVRHFSLVVDRPTSTQTPSKADDPALIKPTNQHTTTKQQPLNSRLVIFSQPPTIHQHTNQPTSQPTNQPTNQHSTNIQPTTKQRSPS